MPVLHLPCFPALLLVCWRNAGSNFLTLSHILSLWGTPNKTGRRFHRTMEMIPALLWKAKSPSVSRLRKLSIPFWPECLHIKFPKIYLCKAIFYIFEIRFRKIKICNVIFYLRQINSPEFKYVISWVVRKAMCLRRRFSQEVSLEMHALHQESLIFHRIWPFLVQSFPGFSPVAPRILCFSQAFPSSENPWVFHRISLF